MSRPGTNASDPRDLAKRLTGYVASFADRPVVVLGDMLADEFLYGDIARISREAPVLILEHRATVSVPGGAANSVSNLRSLGARPLPVGVVGDDEPGRRLLDTFEQMQVETHGLLVLDGHQTPSKCRILAGGVHTRRQQIVRIDRGGQHGELSARTRSAIRGRLRAVVGGAEGVMIADYGYGAASPQVVETLLARWISRGLCVTADSRGRVSDFRGIGACTPNQEELEQALGVDELPDEQIESAGRRLLRRCRNQAVLVTRGAKGMVLVRPRVGTLSIPAYGTDEVADVTGAGDTVISTFTLALLAGADYPDAARRANYAAGIVVTKAGTATTTPAELTAAILEDLS
jgi:rfaE bifunctional protein kinase chain/domain